MSSFLKTGPVKLIYIDPPFASESDFRGKDGVKAYNDKVNGAEFVEFLRRRLVLAFEILAPDGSIYVHLDWKKSHYIKAIMDEVFGPQNFKNSVIWHYGERMMHNVSQFNRKHDVMYYVDYFAKAQGELDDPDYDMPMYIDKLKEIIEKGLKMAKKSPDIKVKYSWMKNKYNIMIKMAKILNS